MTALIKKNWRNYVNEFPCLNWFAKTDQINLEFKCGPHHFGKPKYVTAYVYSLSGIYLFIFFKKKTMSVRVGTNGTSLCARIYIVGGLCPFW